jgi:hypothetical protein
LPFQPLSIEKMPQTALNDITAAVAKRVQEQKPATYPSDVHLSKLLIFYFGATLRQLPFQPTALNHINAVVAKSVPRAKPAT